MNVSYRNLMSSQKLTNNSTHFSFLVLLCINKNSLKDFSVLKIVDSNLYPKFKTPVLLL